MLTRTDTDILKLGEAGRNALAEIERLTALNASNGEVSKRVVEGFQHDLAKAEAEVAELRKQLDTGADSYALWMRSERDEAKADLAKMKRNFDAEVAREVERATKLPAHDELNVCPCGRTFATRQGLGLHFKAGKCKPPTQPSGEPRYLDQPCTEGEHDTSRSHHGSLICAKCDATAREESPR